MIHARGVTKKFGQVVAVDNVDLDVEAKGLVGFLGPNGAGKTTTMRMLTGALPMTSGTAHVAGFDVFEHPIEVKARVGYLPETPPLYPDLSVGEYLKFVAEIRGVSRKQRLNAVGKAMERVGLSGWESRLTGSLSKGYRQRVGLAQALLHDPSVIVLDEPTSGLDPAQLVGIRKMIRELATEKLVILSTHILPEVEAMCERVVLIHQGRIVGDGTVESLAAEVGAGPWFECRFRGPDEQATAEIAGIDAVDAVQALPSDIKGEKRFRVEGGDGVTSALAALAVRIGWKVEALTPHSASLEEVFLSLVEVE